MDLEFHKQLEVVLAKNNLTIEEVFNLLLTETVRQGRIPFDYTEADIEEARNNPCVTVIIND